MSILKLLSKPKVSQRQIKGNFGVTIEQFEKIEQHFTAIFESKRAAKKAARWANKVRKKKEGSGKKPKLPTARAALAFTLYYLKQYPTFDCLGAQFDMDGSTANKLFHEHRVTLQQALDEMQVLPKTGFKDVKEFQQFLKANDLEQLLIDAVERLIQRPGDQEVQKAFYSGKKKDTLLKIP